MGYQLGNELNLLTYQEVCASFYAVFRDTVIREKSARGGLVVIQSGQNYPWILRRQFGVPCLVLERKYGAALDVQREGIHGCSWNKQ